MPEMAFYITDEELNTIAEHCADLCSLRLVNCFQITGETVATHYHDQRNLMMCLKMKALPALQSAATT